MWFSVHAIFYFKMLNSEQDSFLVHENIYMLEAKSAEDAEARAVLIGRENEDSNEDGHLELNGKRAAYLFAGVRKTVKVETDVHEVHARNLDGREISYSVYEVDNFEEVMGLSNGEMVAVLYRE